MGLGNWLASTPLQDFPERAEYFAQRCIEVGENNDLPPYYVGYGYEASARAKVLQGERQAALDLISRAKRLADQVPELDDRMVLLDDLNAIP